MRMNMSDFATFFAVARNQSFRAAGDELVDLPLYFQTPVIT